MYRRLRTFDKMNAYRACTMRALSPTVHSDDRERARCRVEQEGGWDMRGRRPTMFETGGEGEALIEGRGYGRWTLLKSTSLIPLGTPRFDFGMQS